MAARAGGRSQPRSDAVFDTLRTEILSGLLAPGDRINEVDIARRLGVSHTPVREAIGNLIGQGFIESGPNRHRQVARYSPRRAVELVQLQGLLYRYGLLRIAHIAPRDQVVELADSFASAADALRHGQAVRIHAATAAVVEAVCHAAQDTALAKALPHVSQRGFALALLPEEAWQLWRSWGEEMDRFARQLRRGVVGQTAEDYYEAELALAEEIARRWPEAEPWAAAAETGQTRAAAVAERLRAEIFGGRLRPGEPVREVDIAARYGVSTTPVREALRELAGEGIVDIGVNRRRTVAQRSPDEMRDLLNLTHHLITWQTETGVPSMSEDSFTAMCGHAADLARHADANSPGLSADYLEFWESLAEAAGNKEVWGIVRSGLLTLLTQWARTAQQHGANADVYRRISQLTYPASPRELLQLIDELAGNAQPRGLAAPAAAG